MTSMLWANYRQGFADFEESIEMFTNALNRKTSSFSWTLCLTTFSAWIFGAIRSYWGSLSFPLRFTLVPHEVKQGFQSFRCSFDLDTTSLALAPKWVYLDVWQDLHGQTLLHYWDWEKFERHPNSVADPSLLSIKIKFHGCVWNGELHQNLDMLPLSS